jgi:hypothetical protein
MTMNFSANDTSTAKAADKTLVDFLEEVDALYREAAAQLFDALKIVKSGRFEDSKAVANAVRDLKQSIEWVMDERNRVDKLRKSVAGALGGSEIDFAAARDEIGRRLVVLREAGGH